MSEDPSVLYRELARAWQELTAPGAPFETVRVEVQGVSLLAYARAAPDLRAVWRASARHADRDYLVYRDERWSYAAAHREVEAVAAWLAAQGVGRGDRVAIAMRNYPEWLLAYWAALSVGASVVGMNAWWTAPELLYALGDSAPKVLVCDAERLERLAPLREELAGLRIVAVRSADAPADAVPWSELAAQPGRAPEVEIEPDDEACIFYTSGTTGRPKGAQLTHRGCTNHITSMAFAARVQAMALQRAGRRPSRRREPSGASQPAALVVTPLFHVTANNCVAHGMTVGGGKLVHLYKWDAAEALRAIERERVTSFSGVPTMLRELIAHPDFERTDTSSLVALAGGGAPVQPDLVRKVESRGSGRAGTGYGMTETSGIVTSISADFFADRPESAGPAMPCFETKCVDEEGHSVAPGELGELCVRGAQVIRGYLNRPEETAAAIRDGWLRTGDIARVDGEGFLYLVDRAKDMVLRGGENVYCAEVESVLFEHEGVAECAVFGVADERLGEEVAAAVVLAPGAALEAEALRAFCAERIARYKVPRYVWLLDAPLPRNATGKILKRELRARLDLSAAS